MAFKSCHRVVEEKIISRSASGSDRGQREMLLGSQVVRQVGDTMAICSLDEMLFPSSIVEDN